MSQGAALVLVASGSRPPRRWLVVRRPEPPHEWAIPGGHIDPGETPAPAAVRELREETAIGVLGLVPLGIGPGPVHVFAATRWHGRPWAAEGWPVTWLTWTQLRAQATRYGAFLDMIARNFRARYGEPP